MKDDDLRDLVRGLDAGDLFPLVRAATDDAYRRRSLYSPMRQVIMLLREYENFGGSIDKVIEAIEHWRETGEEPPTPLEPDIVEGEPGSWFIE